MVPNNKWIEDWQMGVNPSREKQISLELFGVLTDFWKAQGLDEKAKTTKNRYSGALHSIGGYLVEQAISDDGTGKSAQELLSEHIGPYDGPLICHDNETWQNEIDMVSRKLHKYLKTKC